MGGSLAQAMRRLIRRTQVSRVGRGKQWVFVAARTVKERAGMSRIETEALENLLRRRRSLSAPSPRNGGDPAARWQDYEMMPDPLPDGVRRELEDIDAALARIRDGRYGRCLSCGGPMGLQRLRAIPEAKYCVACSGQPSGDE